ncbi:MAG: tetratricopeptide repeat protein [Flavobacteriaceae bacterium]|nr:tetratricopeptide repeat protein [Flavobacteriaceae bacterium]
MKKIIFLIIFLMSWVNHAQNLDSLFVQANKLYQQESYLEALKLYQEIENGNVESDELFFNIANVYYRTNQVAPSIYYYEKALLLNPNNKDIAFNLNFAKRMTLDNIEALPRSMGQRFRENVILKLTYNTWATISVSLAFLFAILFLLYHFSYSTSVKRIYFITSILSVFFVLITLLFTYQNYQYVKNTRTAIIFEQLAQVKSAPTKSSEVNFELHEGAKVSILESLDNWLKIKIADGKTGWINEDALREL